MRDAGNRQVLGNLRAWMEDVSLPARAMAKDASLALITRLNSRFGPLLDMARVFLDGGTLQMAAGEVNTFAFVFDMNRLFEAFVASMIERYRAEILPSAWRRCRIIPQSAGVARYLAWIDDRAAFRLEPDIAFQDGNTFPLLIDTKYKLLRDDASCFGMGTGDFYQMYAYARL